MCNANVLLFWKSHYIVKVYLPKNKVRKQSKLFNIVYNL